MHLCELEVPTEPTEVPKGVDSVIAISGNMVETCEKVVRKFAF